MIEFQMMFWLATLALAMAVMAGEATTPGAGPATAPVAVGPVFGVPRLDKVKADGEALDWADAGLRRRLAAAGAEVGAGDFAAELRLGWTADGLTILLAVTDSTDADAEKPAAKGAVEIFLSRGKGKLDRCQWVIDAGVAAGRDEPDVKFMDHRGDEVRAGGQPAMAVARKKTARGYVLEAVIGLDALQLKPEAGTALALQIMVHHAEPLQGRRTLLLHHLAEPYAFLSAFQNLRLTQKASELPDATVSSRLEPGKSLVVRVVGAAGLAGRPVTMAAGDKELFKAMLAGADDAGAGGDVYAACSVDLGGENPPPVVEVRVDGVLLAAVETAPARTGRWELAIRDFEKQDQRDGIKPGGLMLYGSSTFTGWKTYADDLAGVQVVNRGFGGSGSRDLALYLDRVVAPRKAAAVVIYAGGNDRSKLKPSEIVEELKSFCALMKERLPATRVYLVSLKPTGRHWAVWAQTQETNRLMQEYAAGEALVCYVDVVPQLLGADGKPDPRYTKEDQHHPSAEGYRVLAEAIKAALKADGLIK